MVPDQEPRKPGSELRGDPGEIDALYERLVIVTALPLWVEALFQSCVMACPLGKANLRLQPLMVVEPVFVIVKAP